MKILILTLALLPIVCRAEFDFLHTALESVVNEILAEGDCAKIRIAWKERFTAQGAEIKGMNYAASCIKRLDRVITWTPPTQRLDGTAFDMCVEGKRYLMQCGDQEISIPRNVSHYAVMPGMSQCKILAEDQDGIVSGWSQEVIF